MATITDFARTDNLKSASSGRQGKTLAVKTVVQTLKPRRYSGSWRPPR